MNLILFVGSNPSNASTCDIAFHWATRSSQILTSWCKDVTGHLTHINVMNEKTEDNRPLKKSEIKLNLERLKNEIDAIKPNRIVALGRTATTALTLLGVEFYEMPHPSGSNRKLNDKLFVAEKIKGLTEFCNKVNPNTDSN